MSLINLIFFKKYSGLDLGLALDSFSSRSRTLGLKIFRSRSRSWSRKNFTVSVSNHVVSTTSLVATLYRDRFQRKNLVTTKKTSSLLISVQSLFYRPKNRDGHRFSSSR